VNSHLHFDHAGGNEHVPNADLVVQRREWEAGHDPDIAAANAFMAKDYDHGHRLCLADGEHDLFGDGSAVCVPTYGHTPGHQSLLVQTAGGRILLTGDACYLRRSLEELHLPMVVQDREQMMASLLAIRGLQARGARIFYGHDPEFWESVPQAPARVA
jgi:N-acyl homoserine lactone hydrolase